MNFYWQAITAGDLKVSSGEYKLVLNAFTSVCQKCKESGHKGYECPQKDGQNGERHRKFNSKCSNRRKIGHIEKNCWNLEAHKEKCPKLLMARIKNMDMLLWEKVQISSTFCMDSQTLQFMLSNPNMQIADLAATTDFTLNEQGTICKTNAMYADSEMMGSGENVKAKMIGFRSQGLG